MYCRPHRRYLAPVQRQWSDIIHKLYRTTWVLSRPSFQRRLIWRTRKNEYLSYIVLYVWYTYYKLYL